MKISICEDESLFSSFLKREIDKFFKPKSLSIKTDIFADGNELLAVYQQGDKYDVIFMDIGLKESDGMKIAARIREFDKKAVLIFVTSFDNRAIEGYDVNAFGYIVKSTLKKRLPELLERLWSELTKERALMVSESGVLNLLFIEDIMAVESSGRKAVVHTYNEIYTVSENISGFSEKLPADLFIECHKSVFVNITKVKRIDANNITLENGKNFPVSRRNRKMVILAVMKRIGAERK